ncbi:kinase-like domain-containing protein [Geranomyces variabilis]|nr:kinase-like domain-containing protein [Geranomyces variabilis]KAJ3143665.1 hypothetical protein HDU90_000430 [Geranomyces variabilis]
MSPPRRLPAEPLSEVAADEVEALRAIFADDFAELATAPTSAWNLPPVRIFSIVLRPTELELADRCRVRLEFSFSPKYPSTPATLKLSKMVGVSDSQLEFLLNNAKEFASARKGQEMIYDIASFIQEQLSKHNSVIRGVKQVSFFEQMQDRREQDEKAEQERAEQSRELNRRREEELAKESNEVLASQIQEELNKKQALIKEERERRRKLAHLDAEPIQQGGSLSPSVRCSSSSPTSPQAQLSLSFEQVERGPCTQHGLLSTIYLANELSAPSAQHSLHQHLAIIKEVVVLNSHYLSGEGKKKFMDICTEIQHKLLPIRHPNLVSVFDTRVLMIPSAKESKDSPGQLGPHWKLEILLERCHGGSLDELIQKSGGVRLSVATGYMKQLLKAVAYIHSLNMIHKDIKTQNVLFAGGSDPQCEIKLANSSYGRKLLDLHKVRPLKPTPDESRKPAEWLPPELLQRPVYGRKTDIWSLGTTFLEMLFGAAVYSYADYAELSPKILTFSPDVEHFVSRMLAKDPKDRATAMELMEHPLFGEETCFDLPVALEVMRSSAALVKPDNSFSRTLPVPIAPSTPLKSPAAVEEPNIFNSMTISRYRLDFEEIEFLGKGGFGEVVKARNRIDGRFYAIKKIKLNPQDREGSKRILREVQTLSRLHHQYVVRYYQAWFEDAGRESRPSGSDDSDSESESGDDDDDSTDESDSSSQASDATGLLNSGFDNDWLSIDRVATSKSYSQVSISFGYGAAEDDSFMGASTTDPSQYGSDDTHPTHRQPKRILYIQMEYCENKTLRDEIDAGVDDEEGWRLFRQVLEGLAHIHSQGMIHRDLKPSNVFLDANGNVKIGDFGLALAREDITPGSTESGANSAATTSNLNLDPEASLTGDIGTPVYVAPEIVGNSSGKYNSKVDLYSLGICFFEICYPFSTGMHRALVLRDLRLPALTFPSDFDSKRFDAQAQIIRMLLNHTPKERPSAAELLQSPLLPPKLEEEYIAEALRSIVNQNNPLYYSRLMTSLFEQSTDQHKDFTYDFNSNALNVDQLAGLVTARFHAHCLKVFARHGAIEIRAPLLMPKRDDLYCEVGRKVVELVDSTGCIVHLPYDLTAPFARLISRVSQNLGILPLKRYSIDHVYRCNQVGGQPKTILECDFDIVTDKLGNMCPDAEVIKVVFEMLEFSATKYSNVSDFEIRINHSALLDSALDAAGVSQDSAVRVRVCNILEQLHKPMTWNQVRGHLVAAPQPDQGHASPPNGFGPGLSIESVAMLEKFHQMEGELKGAIKAFELLFGSGPPPTPTRAARQTPTQSASTNKVVKDILAQLRLLGSHLWCLGIRNRVVFAPLLSYNSSHYRGGLMFQIAVPGKKKLDVMAAGGRYDHLLTRFRYPFGPNKKLHAVGVHFALSKAISAIVAEQVANLRSNSAKRERVSHLNSSEDLMSTAGALPVAASASGKYLPFGTAASMAHVPRRADVLVVSFGKQGGALEERMTVISDLWSANISADMVYHDVESPQDVLASAEMHGYRLVVLVKQHRTFAEAHNGTGSNIAPSTPTLTSAGGPAGADVKSGLVKVKNLATRFEAEVSRSDLIQHVLSEISGHSHHHSSHHHHQPHRQSSTGDQSATSAGLGGSSAASHQYSDPAGGGVGTSAMGMSGGSGGAADSGGGGPGAGYSIDPDKMVLLQSPWKKGKIKHKERLVSMERAAHAIAGEISQLRRGSVFSLDLPESVIRKLCRDTDLRSPEDQFRRAFDALPSNQREYLCQVKRQIVRHATETGQKHFWVYSTVDNVSYLYSFN